MMKKTHLTLTLVCALGPSLFASSAHAHIRTTGALMSRGGDIKMDPCDGMRGAGPVYTFAPGATITISVDEFVPHPSYYRIAFSKNGDSKTVFVEPKSIKPIESSRPCPIDANDKCGMSDFCNVEMADGSGVLSDNLNPHTSAQAKSLTFTVTLPNVECDNCTVQVIQVMEDNAFHGDYCPSDSCTDPSPVEDIYHVCIDLKLVKGATNGAGASTAPEQNMGMKCTPATQTAGGAGGASAGGAGTSGAGTSGVAAGAGGMMASSSGAGGSPAVGAAGAAGKSVVGSAGASTGIAGTGATSVAGIGTTGTAGTGNTLTSSAGVSGQLTSGVTGTTASSTPPAAKNGGCSVSTGPSRSNGAEALIGMALGLMAFRRRQRAVAKR
jgi:MYXO-CTERM domain-containing protein